MRALQWYGVYFDDNEPLGDFENDPVIFPPSPDLPFPEQGIQYTDLIVCQKVSWTRTPKVRFKAPRWTLKGRHVLSSTPGIPLVGAQLSEYLERTVGDEIELVPVEVIAKDGPLGGFFYVNALRQAQCVDREKSKCRFEVENGRVWIKSINKYVQLPGCLGNARIARDIESAGLLYIRDDFAEELNREFGDVIHAEFPLGSHEFNR